MRIIAGYLGGRLFESPGGHRTHPMSDKMRGALFNALGDITGLTLLDAFAGTGACSFEAISRGATSVTAVDIDKKAIQTIRANAADLKIEDSMTIIHANSGTWSNKNRLVLFDICIFDPPYDGINYNLLEKLVRHLKIGGLAIFSLPPRADLRLPADKFELVSSKSYGDATLNFYRKTG